MTEIPMRPIKATILDDDKFRLLAIPFGGPIPHPAFPNGVDLDGQTFSERTDIRPDWLTSRPVDWHHGSDGTMKRTTFGKAMDLVMDDEGWWVDVWLEHGARRLDLIRRLAERGAQLFGSSETVQGTAMLKTVKGSIVPWQPNLPGEITFWPYWRQTLSTSPQNTHSVLRPSKAQLDDTTPAFWRDLRHALDDLGKTSDLTWRDLRHALDDLGKTSDLTSGRGEDGAKAGRVLSGVNQSDLEEALASIGASVERMKTVLARQTSSQPPG